MKTYIARTFACVAALVAASSAYAAPLPSQGHYEWRVSMQQHPGPRATLLAPERVWVTTATMMSGTDDHTRTTAHEGGANAASCMSRRAS